MSNHQIPTVAVVGIGRQGMKHVQVLDILTHHKKAQLIAVCDPVTAPIPNLPHFEFLDQMYEQCHPDIVVIATPNDTHYPLAKLALSHGSHVIKEKPLARTLLEGEALHSIAALQQKNLVTIQQRYFFESFQRAKQLLPLLGKIEHISYTLTVDDTVRSWYWQKAAGGGVWLNLGWHTLAVIQWLFGGVEEAWLYLHSGGRRRWEYDTDHTAEAKLQITTTHGTVPALVKCSCVEKPSEIITVTSEEGYLELTRSSIKLHTGKHSIEETFLHSSEQTFIRLYEKFFTQPDFFMTELPSDVAILKTIQLGFDNAVLFEEDSPPISPKLLAHHPAAHLPKKKRKDVYA